jgi:hypothetical protein
MWWFPLIHEPLAMLRRTGVDNRDRRDSVARTQALTFASTRLRTFRNRSRAGFPLAPSVRKTVTSMIQIVRVISEAKSPSKPRDGAS